MGKTMRKLFALGQTVITTNAAETLDGSSVLEAIIRHQCGDWGECCPQDRDANEEALVTGARIFSVYRDSEDVKFWIITEWDRSVTTVLLPEDY